MTIPTALLAIALSPFAAGQTAWDSEAETHWLMSLGRSLGDPTSHRRHQMTRFEFAYALASLSQWFAETEQKQTPGAPPNEHLWTLAKRSDEVRDRVIRFAPELRRLGFEGVDGQIAATARRIQAAHLFQDVPLNHWASDALRDLKAIGVLRGYPGGVFDQPNPNQRNAEVRPGR